MCVDRSRTRRLGSHSTGRNSSGNAGTAPRGAEHTPGDLRIRDSTPRFLLPGAARPSYDSAEKSTRKAGRRE
ncbi:hypothetical protein CGRA01v4_09267 [Colletotrichum graminicola]|nr:hypothetical protein CGRA01v4_09267 [Colletotrichum graminicola]